MENNTELEKVANNFANKTIPENEFEQGLNVGRALGFIAGAEYQLKKMFTEEDLEVAFFKGRENTLSYIEWIANYKKQND